MLSKSELAQFRKDGYLFLGQIMETKAVKSIQNRIDDLTQGNIKNPKIQYQIEPKLFKENNPLREKNGFEGPSNSYRKLGPLNEDDIMSKHLVYNEKALSIMHQLLEPPIGIYRSMILLKPAFDGSPLGWHQDAGIPWPIPQNGYHTIWTTFDDADKDNGTLQIIRGSHSIGTPQSDQSTVNERCRKFADKLQSKLVTLEAKAGESYLLNPLMIHGSLPNKSNRSRRAVNVIYMPLNTEIIGYGPLTETDKTEILEQGYLADTNFYKNLSVKIGQRKSFGRKILYG